MGDAGGFAPRFPEGRSTLPKKNISKEVLLLKTKQQVVKGRGAVAGSMIITYE